MTHCYFCAFFFILMKIRFAVSFIKALYVSVTSVYVLGGVKSAHTF